MLFQPWPPSNLLTPQPCDWLCVCLCVEFVIERLPQHGGNVTFTSYADLETAFADKVPTRPDTSFQSSHWLAFSALMSRYLPDPILPSSPLTGLLSVLWCQGTYQTRYFLLPVLSLACYQCFDVKVPTKPDTSFQSSHWLAFSALMSKYLPDPILPSSSLTGSLSVLWCLGTY